MSKKVSGHDERFVKSQVSFGDWRAENESAALRVEPQNLQKLALVHIHKILEIEA